ncbi:MAG: F0F1 ATP synthase subunit A [Terrimicrobiaceae bacterium]|nr:F0F1 ATP synthase subunit A [Terrimicrobiaceae bacterium]
MPTPSFLAAALTLNAPSLFQLEDESLTSFITNSVFVSVVVSAFVIWFCRRATAHLTLVPGRRQNSFEAVVEGLYDTLEGIVGHHMITRCFSLLATLFVFILASNWFALLPGVGSIGWGEREPGFLNVPNVTTPLLRPTTADMNMTLAMAVVFMVMWLYWSLTEVGVKNFLNHIFGVKGGLKGFMAVALIPVFLFVGMIEVVSIAFRPVSLSLRLFGNVFAGENLLTAMITLGKNLGLPEWMAYVASVTVPIPFYFLELLIGVLQATVFMLLCAVYLQLSTSHDDDDEH